MSIPEVQASPRWRPIALWAVKILLALIFLAAGAAKLFGVAAMVEGFAHLGFGQWFRYFTGAVEVIAALLIVVPATSIFGALLIGCTMVGAILVHAIGMPGSALPAAGFLVLSLVVAYAERGRPNVAREARVKITRALVAAGATALLLAILAGSQLLAQTGIPPAKAAKQPVAVVPKAAHRVALPINSEDAMVMKQVLSTALHLSVHYQSRGEAFSMEIVGYSAGVHMFRADTSPVREQLIKLLSVNPNVRFVVCEATKLGMERVEGKPVPLFEKVDLVPNGPAHIIGLQELGWSYIRT